MWSRTDFILGTDSRLFVNVSVRDSMHKSYHYMVLGCLHSASLREHARYFGGRKSPPPPPTDQTDKGVKNFCGPMEGRSETTGLGSAGEHVGPRDNVDTRQQESLRAPGYRKRPSVDLEVGPLHKVNFEGVQEMAGRGGGSGGGATVGVAPPSSPG